MLSQQPWQQLTVTQTGANSVRVKSTNVQIVDAYIDQHPVRHHVVCGHAGEFALSLPRRTDAGHRTLRLAGFRAEKLVAATRLRLQ